MNPTDPNQAWARLTASARRAPSAADMTAPYGFSTRVAALAFSAAERPMRSLFERFSLRAVGVASMLAVLSVVANYTSLTVAAEEEINATGDDPVEMLLGPIE
jgi:hypothetical protein